MSIIDERLLDAQQALMACGPVDSVAIQSAAHHLPAMIANRSAVSLGQVRDRLRRNADEAPAWSAEFERARDTIGLLWAVL